jgi:hypothetical protein
MHLESKKKKVIKQKKIFEPVDEASLPEKVSETVRNGRPATPVEV